MSKKQSFLSGLSFDIISRLIFILAGYSLNIILARYLGPVDYADIALILSLLTIYNVFLTNGVRQSIANYATEKGIALQILWKKSFLSQTLISLLLTAIALLCARLMSVFFRDESLFIYFIMVAIVIPFNGYYFLQIGLLNGLKRFKEQSIVASIYSIVRFLLILFIVFVFNLSVEGVIIGTALAYIVAFFSRYFFIKTLNSEGNAVSFRSIFSNSIKYIHLFFLITVFLNIDIFLQKKYLTNDSDIGVYGAVASLGRFSYFLFFSVTSTFFPIVTELWNKRKHVEIRIKVNKIYHILIIVSLLIYTVVELFSKEIMYIMYGQEYLSGAGYIGVYTLAISFLSLNVFFINVLSIISNAKKLFVILWSFLFFSMAISYYMFDIFNVKAVPLSLLICQLIMHVVLLFLINKKFVLVFVKYFVILIGIYFSHIYFFESLNDLIFSLLMRVLFITMLLIILYFINKEFRNTLDLLRNKFQGNKSKKN